MIFSHDAGGLPTTEHKTFREFKMFASAQLVWDILIKQAWHYGFSSWGAGPLACRCWLQAQLLTQQFATAAKIKYWPRF
jgi:hypothetical protein